MPQLMQDMSIFKPVILAGINAIMPVFGPAYVDEFGIVPAGGSSAVQIRGAFSTERRRAPNIVVTYTPGTGVFNSGQNIIGFDEASGLYKYGFYMNNGAIKYSVQARNELEREWLIDTMFNAFTALVFLGPSGEVAINNLGDYLASQGVVIKGPGQIEYPHVIQSDTESPRPEGQVWEGSLSMVVDVSLTYYMPGVSASTVSMTGTSTVNKQIPIVLPWIPQPRDNPPISLSYP
jgi:hypothetical protein